LLIFAGAAWMLIGVQIAQEPRVRFSNGMADAQLIFSIMDSTLWGWLWVVCGFAAVVIGFCRNCRPFSGRDEIGFNLIVTPAIIWTLFFGTSYVTSLFSDGDFGQDGASYGVVVWGLVSAFIVTLAGWPENNEYSNPDTSEQKPTGPRHRATP
jgi:hypothetical protein